jgi:hypothetical protein
MKFIKELYLFILGIIACLAVFLTGNTGQFIGAFINRYSPCEQNPGDSFPCYGIWDIAAMAIAATAGVVLIVISIYKTIKYFRTNA